MIYLIVKGYYDSDFDTRATYYIYGAYTDKDRAKKECQNYHKARIIEVPINKEVFIGV